MMKESIIIFCLILSGGCVSNKSPDLLPAQMDYMNTYYPNAINVTISTGFYVESSGFRRVIFMTNDSYYILSFDIDGQVHIKETLLSERWKPSEPPGWLARLDAKLLDAMNSGG